MASPDNEHYCLAEESKQREKETSAAHSLRKLKIWIDKPPPFEQRLRTSPVYLFKPEFTFKVLLEGLIYAVSKYKPLEAEFYRLESIAVNQYEQSLAGWLKAYGVEEEVENVCLQLEIQSVRWEMEIRSAELTAEEKSLLPRTIVAVARVAERLMMSNNDIKRGIGILQGDVAFDDFVGKA